MDYHNDCFKDFSLMVFEKNNLVAICPANSLENEIFSHQGLTYGGIVFKQDVDKAKLKTIFKGILNFLKTLNLQSFSIKSLPLFYHHKQIDLLGDVLDMQNEKVYRTDKVLAVDYNQPFTIHKTKLKNFRKNHNKDFKIKQTDDFCEFWNEVLIPRLKEKHGAKPVHNLEEITLLKSRFPKNIIQFNIYLNDEILAGITIFDKGKVVKSQYGATTYKGEKERALEYLFLFLIHKYKDDGKQFFSMGTVTDFNRPQNYNAGLLKQKEELGCSLYLQKFYRLRL